jgi:predicted RNase H-like HicB family nuclease
MAYLVVIERANANYSAYLPDVPGCVATGKTADAARRNIKTALKMHIAGMREDGLPIPEPSAEAGMVELAP